jgi:hypothetical protein
VGGVASQASSSETVFLCQIVLLLVSGRLLGEAMLRMGQPAVIGQLIAGILLGPSIGGAVASGAARDLSAGARAEGYDRRCFGTRYPDAAADRHGNRLVGDAKVAPYRSPASLYPLYAASCSARCCRIRSCLTRNSV